MNLSTKINRLHRLLLKEKGAFEQAANHVSDNALRCTILSLAQQNNQYAAELCSYLHATRTPLNNAAKKTHTGKNMLANETGVLAFCKNNEKRLATAYQKILKEPVPFEGLQKMMDYQLSGILTSGMQLKLLSSLRHRTAH